MRPNDELRKALLVGLGLDGKGEILRVTRGDNYRLVGGSQDTHEEMQEKAVKFNEELVRREKELHEISREEFHEIAEDLGMHVPKRTS
ncbi:MAG: hypothetical protein V2A58_08875 [Planctomycetota bacterium]